MGIQINGQTDTITAIDGGLNVSGADLGSASAGSLNVTGIVTASGFSGNISGNVTGNVNATGLSTFSGGIQVGATASITIGSAFIKNNAVGLGTTSTTGRNAGVGTASGTLIYNSETGSIEVYTGTFWAQLQIAFDVSGGNVSALSPGNGYVYHTFTSPGTFTVNTGSKNIEVLVVGAGGGGVANIACCVGHGGGGGGGVLYGSILITPGPYPVTVGTGSPAAPGGDSVFNTSTAKGGGTGGYYNGSFIAATSGGSGGGSVTPAGGTSTQTSQGGLIGYGNAGGTGPAPGSPGDSATGGGGGGAGAAGTPGSPGPLGPRGTGGNGLQYSQFIGPLIGVPSLAPLNGYFGGGGGGGVRNNFGSPYTAGSGGLGGGGNGGPVGSSGSNGTANSGGGAGGPSGGAPAATSTTGGSGIVIIRYLR